MIKIGFTGTRDGMTKEQKASLAKLLTEYRDEVANFHHGDCLGADAEAHRIARGMDIPVVVHPPENGRLRAFCKGVGVTVLKPKKYLVRDCDIAYDTSILIAAPKGPETYRSGTWYTVRHGIKLKRIVILLLPDGTMTQKGKES